MFLCVSDVATCEASDRTIQIVIVDRHLSERVCGSLLLGEDSFYKILISTVNMSYNGED